MPSNNEDRSKEALDRLLGVARERPEAKPPPPRQQSTGSLTPRVSRWDTTKQYRGGNLTVGKLKADATAMLLDKPVNSTTQAEEYLGSSRERAQYDVTDKDGNPIKDKWESAFAKFGKGLVQESAAATATEVDLPEDTTVYLKSVAEKIEDRTGLKDADIIDPAIAFPSEPVPQVGDPSSPLAQEVFGAANDPYQVGGSTAPPLGTMSTVDVAAEQAQLEQLRVETVVEQDALDAQYEEERIAAPYLLFNQYKNWSPTAEDEAAIEAANSVTVRLLEFIDSSNPDMASGFANNMETAILIPEVAAAFGDETSGGIALEKLFGGNYADVKVYADSEFEIKAWTVMSQTLDPQSLITSMNVLQGLDGRMRDSMFAEIMSYVSRRDITSANQAEEFRMFVYRRGYDKQQEWFSMQSGIGQVGEVFAQPYRGASELYTDVVIGIDAYSEIQDKGVDAFFSSLKLDQFLTDNPGTQTAQDAWWRRELSPGQNVALAADAAPGTESYERISGTADLLTNIVGDPIAWAGNFAAGYKSVQGVAALAEAVPKTRLLAKAVVPIYGKAMFDDLLRARGSSKFIFTRVGQSMGAQTAEQLTTTPAAWKAAGRLAQLTDPARIMDEFPQLENSEVIVDLIASERGNTAQKVQRILADSLQGGHSTNDDTVQIVTNVAADADRDLNRIILEQVAAPDIVGPGTFLPRGVPDDHPLRATLDSVPGFETGSQWENFDLEPSDLDNVKAGLGQVGIDIPADEIVNRIGHLNANQIRNLIDAQNRGMTVAEWGLKGAPDMAPLSIWGTNPLGLDGEAKLLKLIGDMSGVLFEGSDETVLVFRQGPLDVRAAGNALGAPVSDTLSFTTNKHYNYKTMLGGLRRTDERFFAYEVKKSDVIAAEMFGGIYQNEVLIDPAKVKRVDGVVPAVAVDSNQYGWAPALASASDSFDARFGVSSVPDSTFEATSGTVYNVYLDGGDIFVVDADGKVVATLFEGKVIRAGAYGQGNDARELGAMIVSGLDESQLKAASQGVLQEDTAAALNARYAANGTPTVALSQVDGVGRWSSKNGVWEVRVDSKEVPINRGVRQETTVAVSQSSYAGDDSVKMILDDSAKILDPLDEKVAAQIDAHGIDRYGEQLTTKPDLDPLSEALSVADDTLRESRRELDTLVDRRESIVYAFESTDPEVQRLSAALDDALKRNDALYQEQADKYNEIVAASQTGDPDGLVDTLNAEYDEITASIAALVDSQADIDNLLKTAKNAMPFETLDKLDRIDIELKAVNIAVEEKMADVGAAQLDLSVATRGVGEYRTVNRAQVVEDYARAHGYAAVRTVTPEPQEIPVQKYLDALDDLYQDALDRIADGESFDDAGRRLEEVKSSVASARRETQRTGVASGSQSGDRYVFAPSEIAEEYSIASIPSTNPLVEKAPDSLQVLDESKTLVGIDSYTPATTEILNAKTMQQQAKIAVRDATSGRRTLSTVIDEMPRSRFPQDIRDGVDAVFYPATPVRAALGLNNKTKAGAWWRRVAKSRLFGGFPPSEINAVNKTQGRQDLIAALRYYGVPEDKVQDAVRIFWDADFVDRHAAVRKIISDAADEIENPLISTGLKQYVEKGYNGGYGTLGDSEILTTLSKTAAGKQSPRPPGPTFLSQSVSLPDGKEFVRAAARYKSGKLFGSKFRRGYVGPTMKKRKRLGASVRRALKERYGDLTAEQFEARFSPDEIERMAYSVVGLGPNGDNAVGWMANSAYGVNKVWRGFTKAFTVAQLVGRPITWFGRVILDENFRASFAQMPTMAANPVRALSRFRDARSLRKVEQFKAYNAGWAKTVMQRFSGMTSNTEIIVEANKIFPDLKDIVDLRAWDTTARARRGVAQLVNRAGVKGEYGQLISGVAPNRQRGYRRAIKVGEEIGIDVTQKGFSWSNTVEEAGITNHGMAFMMGMSTEALTMQWTDTMSPNAKLKMAQNYHDRMNAYAKDPVFRLAMGQMADELLGTVSGYSPVALATSVGYRRMEPYVLEWAAENGIPTDNKLFVLQQYLDQRVKPFIREFYAPLLTGDTMADGRVLDEIVHTRQTTIERAGEEFTIRLDNSSQGYQTTADMLETIDIDGFEGGPLPTFTGTSSFAGQLDEPLGWWSPKKAKSQVLTFFGDTLSQRGMRQPALVDVMARQRRGYINLGLDEGVATELAKYRAGEAVNMVFYNTKSVTPFLKSMNQVVPFFTAAWEIAETWAWKIPMMQGGAGIGHVRMIRKVDRVMDALQHMGVVKYDENGKPTLQLDTNPEYGSEIGRYASRYAAKALQQPGELIEYVANMGLALSGSDTELDIVPDRFDFSVSSPSDWQNYGIGSAIDDAFGINPILGLVVTGARNFLNVAPTNITVEAEGTLAAFAEDNESDVYRLIAYNAPAFREKFGSETMNAVRRGEIKPWELDITGLSVEVPNTSLWATLIDDYFFPFGDPENVWDVARSYSPSWLTHASRGLGLWQDGEPSDGFMNIDLSGNTKAASSRGVVSALQHMQANERVFDELDLLKQEFKDAAKPYLDAGSLEIVEGGKLVWKGEKPVEAPVVDALWETQTAYSDSIMERAVANAAGTAFLRGFLGFVTPGTPRLFWEEEKALDEYYEARNIAEGNPAALGRSDPELILEYIDAWAADPTGSAAIRAFLDNNPELQATLVGKSYWGPGGQPPLETLDDEYYEDIDRGVREALDPEVWMVRRAIKDNENNRQVAIVEEYGVDPYATAADSIANPQRYSDVVEEFSDTHEMILWEDTLRDSGYTRWKNRNRSDDFSIAEESIRTYNDFNRSLSDVMEVLEVSPLFDPAEVRETTAGLKKLRAGINDVIDEMRAIERDVSFLSPWQRIRNEWFRSIYSPYLDSVSGLYDKLNDSNTSVEQDRIWNEIAALNDKVGDAEYTINGRPMPSPVIFQWENKEPEVQEITILKNMVYKTGWIEPVMIDRLVEKAPQLDDFLPTTPRQQSMWAQFNAAAEQIDADYANSTGTIDKKERDRRRKLLDANLANLLAKEGLSDQITWLYYWPIQKLSVAGQLPDVIVQSGLVEKTNAVQEKRIADGLAKRDLPYKSVGETDLGRIAITRELVELIESDPVFREAIVKLGIELYGEKLPEAIIDRLFFNDNF